MPVEVLILEKNSGRYAAHLRPAFPRVVFHEAATEDEALRRGANAEVIIALAHEISDRLVAKTPRLRWISALTTGTDHLDSLTSLPPDVIVTSGRGIHGPQMSELAFLFMISLSRNFPAMLTNQQRHRWDRWPQRLLLGKTVTVVGVGAIGEELALRCKAFGMTTIGVSAARKEARGFDEMVPRGDLAAAAGRADFLIILAPYSKDTHFMIDAKVLGAMKPEAILINLARGNVVDEQALIASLKDRKIAGAGLDVFSAEPLAGDSPLWNFDNVIVTPHIGGMSDVYESQILPLLTHNIGAFLSGDLASMRNVVRHQS